MKTITVWSINDRNKSYQFVATDEPVKGGLKDVYFSPDRTYVVAIYREVLDENQKQRLQKITNYYLPQIKSKEAASFFLDEVFRWPEDSIEYQGKTGIIVPIYKNTFFFTKGQESGDLIQGKEKNGKWFASAKFRNPMFPLRLAKSELGNWRDYLDVGVAIVRGVKKMHAMGLAHSDLSYNNVLIDPVAKTAVIIDLDGLVVPGLYPADVIGTAEFIAPEVLATKQLDKADPARKLPNRLTDLHALAVLLYMLLLHRHPLKGGKVHDLETEIDDLLSMGEKALFIEHPEDHSNRPKLDQISKWDLPWSDSIKLPYTLTGPHLKLLFDTAFVDGLHHPMHRPVAEAWEQALLKTIDLVLPCSNNSCEQGWFVFDNTPEPQCPFCGKPYYPSLPMIDLYYQFQPSVWKPENHRLVVYENQSIYGWHENKNQINNERLGKEAKMPVGNFAFEGNKWFLVNQNLKTLKDLTTGHEVPVGSKVEITNGKKMLLSAEEGGRVALFTITNQKT